MIRSGWEHFIDFGFYENREGMPTEVYQFIEDIMDNSNPLPYPPEFLRKIVHDAETLRSFRNVVRVITRILFPPYTVLIQYRCFLKNTRFWLWVWPSNKIPTRHLPELPIFRYGY